MISKGSASVRGSVMLVTVSVSVSAIVTASVTGSVSMLSVDEIVLNVIVTVL